MFAEEFHTNGNSSIEQIREEIWIKKRHPHVNWFKSQGQKVDSPC